MVPCTDKVVSQNREKYFIPSAIYFTKSLSPPNGPPANSTDREVTEPSEGKKASSRVSRLSTPLILLVVFFPSCSFIRVAAVGDTSFTVTSSNLYFRYA